MSVLGVPPSFAHLEDSGAHPGYVLYVAWFWRTLEHSGKRDMRVVALFPYFLSLSVALLRGLFLDMGFSWVWFFWGLCGIIL